MEEHIQILKIIERIRTSFPNAVEVYTQGSCIKFAMILKEIYPKGDIYYDNNHAIFKLNNNYYDINGLTKIENHIKLEEFGVLHMYDLMNLTYELKI